MVSDDDVEEQVEQLRARFATVTPVGVAQTGDLVLVDVKGEIDGEEIEDFAGSALTFEVGAEGLIGRASPKRSPVPPRDDIP